jgi:hypothetical protein
MLSEHMTFQRDQEESRFTGPSYAAPTPTAAGLFRGLPKKMESISMKEAQRIIVGARLPSHVSNSS